MKLSFSTRGWAASGWDDLVEQAADAGFEGMEAYNVLKAPGWTEAGGPFHKYSIVRTCRELKERGLRIPCFDSPFDLSEPSCPGLAELIGIASAAGAPYVCAFASTDKPAVIRENLADLIPVAAEKGVTILVKTSGIYSDTALLRELLNEFASDCLAVVWDVHHPYRDKSESPAVSIGNLGAYVRHVHLRDSNPDGSYNLVGEGTFPIRELMNALRSIDYDGFISLEWKPEWMEDLTDPEVILPHFVNYLQRFARGREQTAKLFPNHDGSGYYVWKKDELINLTFPQLLDKMADTFPDQYCFKYTTLDYTRTYAEFRRDADDFARALVSLGVRPGDKVSVWATNIPAWFISFWATVRIGAVLVTVNTAYKVHEAEYLLRQSDTHTLVMIEGCLDSDYKGIINELCPEIKGSVPGRPLHCKRLPFLRNVITVGFRQSGCLTFEEAMERKDLVPAVKVRALAADVHPDDVCNMQYTSGTTGFPKGVMLTHYNVVNNGKCIGDRMGLSTADRMMIQVPMFHCFGMVLSMTSSMTHGAT
ncbi:MAG: AMP-binding protein, partial [Bacteroidales bacterium]|nr:AMP-binding protein [Bacteroidales bacterium]